MGLDRLEVEFSILEMSDNSSIDIPFSDKLDIAEITADDDSPKYAIVEVIRNGFSLNQRKYSIKNVEQIAELIIGKPAYLGHKDPNKVGWEFREPHALFVGSVTETIGDKVRCLAKAYLFKTSELREWLPKTLSAKNPLEVSISASCTGVKKDDGSIIIIDITDLDSVDFCNSNTAGCPTSVVLDVTEMLEEGVEKMDRAEVIASLTIEEIQSCPNFNEAIPKPITEISLVINEEAEMIPLGEVQTRIDELKQRELVVAVEVDGTTENLTGNQIFDKINELYAQRDLLQAKIDEINAKAELDRIRRHKEEKVFEMFGEKQGSIILPRITGETEEAIDAQISEMRDFVNALSFDIIDNPPIPNTPPTSKEDLQSKVNSLFSKK